MKLMLWFAPGALFQESAAELRADGRPPLELRAILAPRLNWAKMREQPSPEPLELETLLFRLSDYSPTGEVAHYELVSTPPAGKRWILIKPGRVCSETIEG